jgi:CheY-like chemotaxis protein
MNKKQNGYPKRTLFADYFTSNAGEIEMRFTCFYLACNELVKESIDNSIPFDLILMDSTMNNMHGPEAVRRLRQDLNFTGKIVGLTGNAHPEDIAVLIAAGCDHVLVKPLQVQKLFDYLTLIGMI